MVRTAAWLAVVIVFINGAVAEPVPSTKASWKAGVAQVNISPELPIWLSGYASRNKPANSKHDDLWAKALVIEDANGRRAAIVTMDLVGIPRDISQAVCKQVEERYKLPRAA